MQGQAPLRSGTGAIGAAPLGGRGGGAGGKGADTAAATPERGRDGWAGERAGEPSRPPTARRRRQAGGRTRYLAPAARKG